MGAFGGGGLGFLRGFWRGLGGYFEGFRGGLGGGGLGVLRGFWGFLGVFGRILRSFKGVLSGF